MKVALTVLRWAGMGISILAVLYEIFISLPTALITLFICLTFPFITFSIVINAIAIPKHVREKQSIAMGVLQCCTLTGIPAGVCMIVATCFRKKLNPTAEVETMVDEAEAVVNDVVEEVKDVVENI